MQVSARKCTNLKALIMIVKRMFFQYLILISIYNHCTIVVLYNQLEKVFINPVCKY